jgi:chemotaxis signal transduction protein
MEFIHLSVNQQQYLLSSENIQEIINYPHLKKIPNSSSYIEGLFNHKGSLVPLISMRKLLNFDSFEDEQLKVLKKVLNDHKSWVEDLKKSLLEGVKFEKNLDPKKCEFGKWISKISSCLSCNQNGFNDLIKKHIIPFHDNLHREGKIFLEENNRGKFEEQIKKIEEYCIGTINGIKKMEEEIDKLTSAFERVIVYDLDGMIVGFTIDSVEKLYELNEKSFFNYKEALSKSNQFIHFIDHYEIDGVLMFSMKLIKKSILEAIDEVMAPA